jgi:glutamyl-Q tRNA(Asp) synthetase
MPPPVFRFAPSPNGLLHLGHAYSALLNFDLARQNGGRLLLRIEDIDPIRCRPEFESAIFEDLEWLGIAWDQPVRRQSDHMDQYRDGLERLEREGLVYPAFESRSQIKTLVAAKDRVAPWPRDPDNGPLYPGEARHMSTKERDAKIKSGGPYVLRLDMTAAIAKAGELSWTEEGAGPNGETGQVAANPVQWGDVVVGRRETPTSYHLSVVIDDALQGVTHAVRGEDLFWATSIHRLLQNLLKLHPPVYRHHPLIKDESGQKLSKSSASTALRQLRAEGATPEDIRRLVGLDPHRSGPTDA